VLHESDLRARRVALNVSGAALLLAIAKAAVGFAAGSIALLSSALDSAGDAIASFANFCSSPSRRNRPTKTISSVTARPNISPRCCRA
jgi:divalent metal cation (Fe/Co/Zn/Cd) transporter